ncbi:glycosyltransferase family 4 protein [Rhizobium halophytocola]|uniref:Glycosyltransferase involved in cell wall biosynthesis n=1 Tax=Rhizobium halophytocola TaxID=735519 RepID=A0ABS4E4A3_9HYPH|nr:glycosyltransferase family 4 protein [Rhizobium halophytocola]MBP1852780.1 glycosyltransferase involved in cell wall biosynthesis [Rhizobium halophytocola]
MSRPTRIAFIGNSLPRQCGIATFTGDLSQALRDAVEPVQTSIVAVTDAGQSYAYPSDVIFEIREESVEDYVTAARILNEGRFDVVSLQHEFGIFGGSDGEFILKLLENLKVPVVTTCHTILAEPTPSQYRVLQKVAAHSSRVVVMAEKGRTLLTEVYGVAPRKIDVIAHGIPDRPFHDPDLAKTEHGYSGRPLILTFGLLSPNKGIEVVIDAMPAILERSPEALYIVLGATHPTLLRQQGEAYRDSLRLRTERLGVDHAIQFLNRFVDLPTLLDFIAMCDVYVTPYLDEAQMTSGTLSYSFGMGSAVVSTPYWHARGLLADGRGVLVPFGDAPATGKAIADLLGDDEARTAMRRRAYDAGRAMIWSHVASLYLDSMTQAKTAYRPKLVRDLISSRIKRPPHQTALKLGHLHTMCDDTGIVQHAVYSVPDRSHGYCVDDNARALLLSSLLSAAGEMGIADRMTASFAAFVEHAWNPDSGRFRNFMSYDRRWLEDEGSEDSHGRTLWALGACALSDTDASRRRWAKTLFAKGMSATLKFRSPRAWAFTLLGLNDYCAVNPEDPHARMLRIRHAENLMGLERRVSKGGRRWFEAGLSYENARLSQALIATGVATKIPAFVQTGVETLRWLMTQQTGEAGHFRAIGTEGFFDIGQPPKPFDQQPVEATATVAACLAAYDATSDGSWIEAANTAFDWFTGSNDHGISLVDPETGSCRDGLHVDRPNENRGAESVLCYLISCVEIGHANQMLSPEVPRAGVRQLS